MDPFIESQVWEDFHHVFVETIREILMPQLRPRYVARVEVRVYIEHDTDAWADVIRPDMTVLEPKGQFVPSKGAAMSSPATGPHVVTLPMPETRRESYLTIRERETAEVVAILVVLSPSNKRAGSSGRQEYLRKRDDVLQSRAHLIEVDLLRGGERMPTLGPFPPSDYHVLVCRGARRPRAEAYPWSLRQPLPTVPVPLAGKDPDASLDLQGALCRAYDRAGYDYSLDYGRPLEPRLNEADAFWVQGVLRSVPQGKP
jgi:hypothetical protein